MTTDIIWPDHLSSAYSGAAVRLISLMQEKRQYLLFGCVELYPLEVPLPPDRGKPETLHVKESTLVSGVTVMPVDQALAWYQSALSGELIVPGIRSVVEVITLALSPEPAMGRLVLAKDLPFECPWHGRPSLHHLVPMNDAPVELEWVTPDAKSRAKEKARSWLNDAAGFDLLAHDEFLFSVTLLVPNPSLRGFACFVRGQYDDGRERLGVRVQPRRGETLEDIRVWFRETRPEGTSTVQEVRVDRLGRGEFDLPERCSQASVEVHSKRYGILGLDEPHGFFRDVKVDSEVLTPAGSIPVPPRRRGEPEGTAALNARDREKALARNVRPTSAEHRVIELRARRHTRSDEAKPDGFWRASARDEVIFTGNRDVAVRFVRHTVGHALHRVIWVDPFFDHIDLREFAFSTQYAEVVVKVIMGREHLRKTVEDGTNELKLVGDVFVADMAALAQELANSRHQVPEVYLMGGPARSYHDRFLVVDDSVWHFGHSFNQVGESAVSMATRLRQPDAIRDLILDDLKGAQSFVATWPALKEAR